MLLRYQVSTLDVWGHCHAECEPDCPCQDTEESCCDCNYWVNDRYEGGILEVESDSVTDDGLDFASDASVIDALISAGRLSEAARDGVEFDSQGGEEFFVVEKTSEKPLLGLEWLNPQ